MRIFLKYVVKSMIEKKGRLALLIMAIALSSLLFISSIGVTETAVNTIANKYIERTDNKELYIKSNTDEIFFQYEEMDLKSVKDLTPEVILMAKDYNDNSIKAELYGREKELINEKMIINDFDLNDFYSNVCIISERTSSLLGYKVGDDIKLDINGEEIIFKVKGISINSGVFYDDSKEKFAAFIPYSYINDKFKLSGRYNYLFASSINGNIDEAVNEINHNNKGVIATALYDKSIIEVQVNQIATYFYLLLIIILIMSVTIIYSSYKLIVIERLKVVGTFFSQGATKRDIINIFSLESILYGLIGGIIGTGGGVAIIYITNYLLSPYRKYGVFEVPSFPYKLIILGIVFSVLLTLIASILPIMKIRSMQVIEIILSRDNSAATNKRLKLIFGVLILFISIGFRIISNNLVTQISPIILLLTIVGTILIIPFFVELISKVIYKLLKNKNGIIALAVKNVYTSKLLKGNINLLFISLLVIVLINSAGNSMTRVITEAYKNLRYDIRIDLDSSEYTNDIDKVEKILKSKEEIDNNTIQKLSLTSVNLNDKSVYMVGIDEDKYLNYDKYIDWENEEYKEVFRKFTNKEEKGVILSQKAAKYINSKIGDLIEVEYKGEKTQLEVVGIVDGKMEYNSVFFLVKNSTIEKYFPNIKCDTIICNFKNSNYTVSDDLRKEVSYYGGSITTYEESIALNVRSNSQIINVLNIFTVIAIIIAGFGVLNNIMISFIQRKGSFAVLAALGLENKQRIMMIIFESLYINILSIIIIMLSQNIQLWYASKVTEVAGLSLNIVFNYKMLPFIILITIIVISVSIIPIIVKSKKFSIIECIRRE